MPTRTTVNAGQVRNELTDADFASANVDGTTSTPSLRTLGTGASQAAAGNDNRFTVSASSYSGHGGLVNIRLATPTVASNALTIAIKTYAGTDPSSTDACRIMFRSATGATGGWTERTITAATSLVISSGSTMGATNAKAFRLWIVAFDDAGTVRLGAINCFSNFTIGSSSNIAYFTLREHALTSSTAEGGAGGADSFNVFYTGSAVTSKPYRILGYLDWGSGLTTAGTWASTATFTQDFGPGIPLPGQIIQEEYHNDNGYSGTTTTIPNDDTIPQNTEGAEFFSKAITPTSACNILEMEVQAYYGSTSAGHLYYGFFQDSTASAIAAGWTAANAFHSGIASYRMLAGTTSSTTIKFRMGPNSTQGGTGSINGYSGSRYLGGAATSFMVLRERMG